MATQFVIIGGGPGRQHGGHPRGAPRRGGHPDRARHRRWGRPPVGLHPVQDHDRHRRGGRLRPPDGRHGPRALRSPTWTWTPSGPAIGKIETHLNASIVELLTSQGVRLIRGTARLKGPHDVLVETEDGVEELSADAVLVSTGSRPADPRLGRARRRAGPHHPAGLSAARAARAPGRDRVGRDRRRVRAHVRLVRLQGHPDREPPAGAAEQGRRGGRRPRGRAAPPGRHASSRGPGPSGIERRPTTVSRSAATTAGWRGVSHALLAIGSIPNSDGLGLEHAGVRGRRRRLRAASTTTASPTCPTSTPPATCRASCRCRRWPPCRAARSPSTSWACTPGSTATSTTTRRRRPSSPSPRSPTSGWPRPRRSPPAARSG